MQGFYDTWSSEVKWTPSSITQFLDMGIILWSLVSHNIKHVPNWKQNQPLGSKIDLTFS